MRDTLPGSTTRGLGVAVVAGLLAVAPRAGADVDIWGARASGEFEVGGRAVTGEDWGTSAEYDEYRDADPGFVGSGRFLVENATEPWYLRGWFYDAGLRDQRYDLEGGHWGVWRLDLGYAELPYVYGDDARSLYSESNGVLNFPDAFQSALQALQTDPAAQSALLGNILADSPHKSLDARLWQGNAALEVSPLEELDLSAGYSIQDRKERMPFGIGFGSPGGTFADFPAPIDQQIHEVTAAARWAEEPWNLEFGYVGSFFEDQFDRLIVDNPLRATDSATAGSSEGRLATAPDNSAHTFRLAGAARIPVEFPARAAATFSYGRRFQNEDFLCHTINTAILPNFNDCVGGPDPLALPADDLDGDVATFLADGVLTARPTEKLNLTGRYRYYDFDNDTPELVFPAHVVNDTTEVVEERRSIANAYKRQNASLEAAYELVESATLHAGYDWDQWRRSRDREVTRLDENGATAGLDLRPAAWAQVRASYEFAIRRLNDYDTFAPFEASEPGLDPQDPVDQQALLALQFPRLRKFDEADRIWNGVDLLTQLVPRDDLTLTFTGAFGMADYDHTDFGLESDERYSLGSETTYQPLPWLGFSTWYTFENIRYEQESRYRPVVGGVVGDDPTNDWSSLSRDQVHNFGFETDLVLVPDRLDATLGYAIQHAVGQTNSGPGCMPGPPTCVLPPGDGGNAVNYPALEDVFQTIFATLTYRVNEQLSLKGQYRFEKFDLTDFRIDDLDPYEPNSNVNGSGVVSPSRDVFLGNRIEDYKAHIFALSLLYRF